MCNKPRAVNRTKAGSRTVVTIVTITLQSSNDRDYVTMVPLTKVLNTECELNETAANIINIKPFGFVMTYNLSMSQNLYASTFGQLRAGYSTIKI